MSSPSVFNHVQLTEKDCPDGIYRVVGTPKGVVTLLRVGDSDGQRMHTGELVKISEDEFDEIPTAENPDGNRPLRALIASHFEMIHWSVRVFCQQLATHPIPATVAVTLIGFGAQGDLLVPIPDMIQGGLILVGSLGLAYIGSGRL